MIIFVLYFLAIILGVILPLMLILFVYLGFWVEILGAPFVPTSNSVIFNILKQANLRKGQHFLELGSGDGRVVSMAVKKFDVSGTGVEIHPMLVWYCQLKKFIQKTPNLKFKRQSFYKTDFSQADVIFTFLLPKTLRKLKNKFLTESKKGTLIISHGFKIEGLENKLVKKLDDKVYPTYYYILK